MKSKWHVLVGLFFMIGLAFSCSEKKADLKALESLMKELDESRLMLPNGWSLSPAGISLPVGDFPMNLVVSPSGKYMAITNNGQSKQSITLIDPVTEKVLDEVEIKKSWYGLVFNKEENRLYPSGGNDNMIVTYAISNSRLEKTDSIVLGKPWPVKISPTGLAIDDEANKLFVATKEDSSLYVVDISSGKFSKIKLTRRFKKKRNFQEKFF